MPRTKTELVAFQDWYARNVNWFGSLGVTQANFRQNRNYQQWISQGAPGYEGALITPRTRAITQRPEFAEREAQRALDVAAPPVPPTPPTPAGAGVEAPPFPTEPPPSGFRWAFDRDLNRWVPQFFGLTAQQRSQRELAEQQLELQRQGAQPQPITPFQEQQFGFQQQQAEQGEAFRQQQLQFQQSQQAQSQAQFQQQLQFQQEQVAATQAEQERQYRSQLAANPINWLQYSAYTGEAPVIQPWMTPLGFQNQGGAVSPQGLQAGQPIPGFQGQAGQREIQTFAGLPQLTTPSAQLQARWGPTAQAQFLGYRRARTGAAPQETQFRLGAGRAPAGRFPGFSRFR